MLFSMSTMDGVHVDWYDLIFRLIVRSVGDDPRARFTTGAFVFLILSPLVLSFLSLAVSSRSLVETNKYLLFSFLQNLLIL